MNALNFYRYLRSYITVNISGGFIERFINLCNKNKIKMWDVVFSDEAVTAKMYCKDFSSLRPLCKKSGVTVKIISKSGLNFDLKKKYIDMFSKEELGKKNVTELKKLLKHLMVIQIQY